MTNEVKDKCAVTQLHCLYRLFSPTAAAQSLYKIRAAFIISRIDSALRVSTDNGSQCQCPYVLPINTHSSRCRPAQCLVRGAWKYQVPLSWCLGKQMIQPADYFYLNNNVSHIACTKRKIFQCIVQCFHIIAGLRFQLHILYSFWILLPSTGACLTEATDIEMHGLGGNDF